MTAGNESLATPYRVEHLSFRYHDPRHRHQDHAWTLQDLSFTVHAGEILGIIGPNGSGKSTLVKVLAGLLTPQQGTVSLGDTPLTEWAPQALARRVAAVFQDTPLGFPFTVAELVLMGRYPHRQTGGLFSGWAWDTRADHAIALQAMQATDVAHLADEPIDRVSTGERQRVYMARALAQEPQVVLLDEPTAHLDAQHQAGLAERLRQMNRGQGLTMVLVTHDLNLASQLCTRLLLLSAGRQIALGPPAMVLRPDILEPVYGPSLAVDRLPESNHPRVTLRLPSV